MSDNFNSDNSWGISFVPDNFNGFENDFSPDNFNEAKNEFTPNSFNEVKAEFVPDDYAGTSQNEVIVENLWGSQQGTNIIESPNQQTNEVNELDFSDLGGGLIEAENVYQRQQMMSQAKPIVEEALDKQKDKMRVELHQVLDDEVGHRLDKYEKRRKHRELKENIGLVAKIGVVLLIVAFFFGNAQLRTRVSIVAKDFGDLFTGLISGETVHSNKLVHDLFRDIDNDIERQDFIEDLGNQDNSKKDQNQTKDKDSKNSQKESKSDFV